MSASLRASDVVPPLGRLARALGRPRAGLLLAAGALTACSGGGKGADEAAAGRLTLGNVTVTSGQTWQINRPLRFTFSAPVDFDSVSMNTIQIERVGGGPALGHFLMDPADPRAVIFQPTCPTRADFSDAGFLPGGVQYRIHLPDRQTGSTNPASTVRALDGSILETGITRTFLTPVVDIQNPNLAELFLDVASGPPVPVVRVSAADTTDGTYLEVGGEDTETERHYFVRDASTGNATLPGGFRTPLNLYSEPGSRISVVVVLNQPVSPTTQNISSQRLRLQFRNASGVWVDFATDVELLENCTDDQARVSLTPTGVLPQDRPLRVLLSPEFEDLVGDRNILPLTNFAGMQSDVFTDGGGTPTSYTDEFLETFVLGGNAPGSFEDTTAIFDTPRANWGNGQITAGFAFDGTGGPDGTFDWVLPPNSTISLDTTFAQITGGPNGQPTSVQTVINGRVDVRDLIIPASTTLRAQGPNPLTILASRNVIVNGKLVVNGNNGRQVTGLNSPNQPEPGAAGNAGGGKGGTGSYLTNQVTVRGGNGFGAFGVADAGGQGGEGGWHPSAASQGINRRSAGGGGGVFGDDIRTGPNANDCPNQTTLGYDAEDGFPGQLGANSAIRNTPMPWGGRMGTGPFSDISADDDFWGIKRKGFGTADESIVEGELASPWAGAGGGAGGDAYRADVFPPPTLVFGDSDKGAGGGGGAGALVILALGDIRLGAAGQIQANGGHGSGGESTGGFNRIGGGSGGGSGGHIILQTASKIDLSLVPQNTIAIIARGGQGGAGEGNVGGADDDEKPNSDAKHVGGDPEAEAGADNPFSENDCPPTGSLGVRRATGGDGGPGIVQFHVGRLDPPGTPGGQHDIIYPSNGTDASNQNRLVGSVAPTPVGYNRFTQQWEDLLVPIFGSISRAQSKWVPLGEVAVAPGTSVPDPIRFLFEGTNRSNGKVLTSGGAVTPLAAILAPAGTLGSPGLPSIDPDDEYTVVMNAAALAPGDAFYKANPRLLRRFSLVIGSQSFEVQSASYSASNADFGGAETLSLTVASDGAAPSSASGSVQLRPRFFGISTSSVADALPDTASIQIDFQAAVANSLGDPDIENVFPGPGMWSTDIEDLNTAPANSDFRFFRFRLTFNINEMGSGLDFSTPRPAMQFLRVPFEF